MHPQTVFSSGDGGEGFNTLCELNIFAPTALLPLPDYYYCG